MNRAWVRPYRPMARPIMAGSSPPGYLRASSMKTGSTRNRPSMRSAKISARAPLERRSWEVMVEEDLSVPCVPALGEVLIFFTLRFCQESKSYAQVN